MQFRLKHPSAPEFSAMYGYDRALGFFCTVFKKNRVLAEYDALHGPQNEAQGILDLLCEHGFIEDPASIGLAMQLLPHADRDELSKMEGDPDVVRAARIILNLRKAAD